MAEIGATYAQTGQSRIWIATDGAKCGNPYVFYNCMKVEGLEKSFGDSEPIFCPDEDNYDQFIQVGSIKGAETNWTSSLVGRMFSDRNSVLYKLAKKQCEFEIQVHTGVCTNPSDFSQFDSAFIIEGVRVSNYSTDPLGALSPDERAAINETVSITAANVTRVFDVSFASVIPSANNGMIGDLVIPPSATCDSDCLDECDTVLAVSPNIGQTANNTEIVYTRDGGVSWNNVIIPDGGGQAPIHSWNIESDGTNAYVFRIDGNSNDVWMTTVPLSDIYNNGLGATLTTGSQVTVPGLIIRINDTSMAGNSIYMVGQGSDIVRVSVPDNTFTTITTDPAFDDFVKVSALKSNLALAITNSPNGSVWKIEDDNASQIPVIINKNTVNEVTITNPFTSVFTFSEDTWYVGASDGTLYCTTDAGSTWSRVGDFGDSITDIHFATKNVGYMVSHNPRAVYRTIDAGNNWKQITSTTSAIDQANSELMTIRGCAADVNSFFVAGRTDTGGVAAPPDFSELTQNTNQGFLLRGITA